MEQELKYTLCWIAGLIFGAGVTYSAIPNPIKTANFIDVNKDGKNEILLKYTYAEKKQVLYIQPDGSFALNDSLDKQLAQYKQAQKDSIDNYLK